MYLAVRGIVAWYCVVTQAFQQPSLKSQPWEEDKKASNLMEAKIHRGER